MTVARSGNDLIFLRSGKLFRYQPAVARIEGFQSRSRRTPSSTDSCLQTNKSTPRNQAEAARRAGRGRVSETFNPSAYQLKADGSARSSALTLSQPGPARARCSLADVASQGGAARLGQPELEEARGRQIRANLWAARFRGGCRLRFTSRFLVAAPDRRRGFRSDR